MVGWAEAFKVFKAVVGAVLIDVMHVPPFRNSSISFFPNSLMKAELVSPLVRVVLSVEVVGGSVEALLSGANDDRVHG